MAIQIGTIKYSKDDEDFEVDAVKIVSQEFHEESGGYKEPNDVVETVKFEANTEHGIITGKATARRSGFDSSFELEDIEISINSDDEIDISTPECTIENDDD